MLLLSSSTDTLLRTRGRGLNPPHLCLNPSCRPATCRAVRARSSLRQSTPEGGDPAAPARRRPDPVTHAHAGTLQLPGQDKGAAHNGRPAATPAPSALQPQPQPQQAQPQQQRQQQQQHKKVQQPHANHTAYTFVAPNWEPLVGRSKQHMRVEKEVLKSSSSSTPLVVSGDVGLNTLRVAATVHALGLGDEDTNHPVVVVDCSTAAGVEAASQLLRGNLDGVLPGAAENSLHSNGNSLGIAHDSLLVSALADGTLVLDNIHKSSAQFLALASAAVSILLPAASSGAASAPAAAGPAGAAGAAQQPGSFLKAHRTRLILISQLPLVQLLDSLPAAASSKPQGDHQQLGLKGCPSIALPALRARSSDIPLMAVAAGRATAALRGYSGICLTASAEMQLTSYEFPGNESELQGLVQRAIMLHPPAAGAAAAAVAGSSTLEAPPCSWEGEEEGESGAASAAAEGQAGSRQPLLTLDGGDFWAATGDADRGRVDVLEVLPWLRKYILETGFWPVGVNNLVSFMYPLVLLSLFLGPQDRESSAALTVFWAGWWPLVMLSFPFVGRAWCAMCPFMITGEAAQSLAAHGDQTSSNDRGSSSNKQAAASAVTAGSVAPAGVWSAAAAAASSVSRGLPHLAGAATHMLPHSWRLHKWPNESIEPWAGWFVVAFFAGILMWEQVWDLPEHAALSGWLLVLITAGAVACSVLFERRLWCRWLCPIGAMNGLFAKLSCTEIRNRPQLCAAAACTKPCHKGRVEHQILRVPASDYPDTTTVFGLPIPPWASSLLPWASSAAGSSPDTNNLLNDGVDCSCSTSLDASSSPSAFVSTDFNGGSFAAPSTVSGAAAPAGAAVGSTGEGLVLLERDVVFPGCPLNSSPGRNIDNSQCIMCGNCLRSCTSGSAQWRLRPPAADLWRDHQASWTEVHLMNVLMSSVLLHKLPEVCAQLGLPADQIMSEKGPHLLLCAALLAAPSAASWAFHKAAAAVTNPLMDGQAARTGVPAGAEAGGSTLARAGSVLAAHSLDEMSLDGVGVAGEPQDRAEGVSLLKISYSVLPLVWAGIFAHYEDLLLTELGLLAPRFALSMGASPDASWLAALPTLGPAQAAVVGAAQGLTLFVGAALSLALAGKIGSVEVQHGRARVEEVERAVLPQRLLTLLMAAELWQIIL